MISIYFEMPREDRVSPTYGPFEWCQLTYDILRVSPDGDDFAYMDANELWHIVASPETAWTDIIIG